MPVPEQIRKQTEAVKELYDQMNNEADEANGVADDGVESKKADELDTVDAELPSSDEQHEGGKKSGDTFEQKYRTLQGMYNAEVPRLRQQLKQAEDRVQGLEKLLATMQSMPMQANPDTMTQAQYEKLLSEQDVADYGESIDVMRKVSREEYLPFIQKIAELEGTIKNLQTSVVPQVNNLATQQAQSREQAFWSQLSSSVPNWQQINNDADFQTWLLEQDPLTGVTRQSALEQAQRSLDVGRVVRFFEVWSNLNGGGNVAQNTRNGSVNAELQRQIAPGKGRSSKAPTGAEGKIYSPDDIKSFFDDVRKGKFRGREAERDRIERDIFAAQRDGRIQA